MNEFNWIKLDMGDKTTWPPVGQNVFVASARSAENRFFLGIAKPMHGRDMVSVFKPWKWEDKIFLTGIHFTACYWRPLHEIDFPPDELT